jgi:tRNA A-37 threonylcarbamoyl transferase component Bud32
MPDDELLMTLLERWEDAREQGTPLTPEELCQDYPHMLPELTRRIGQLLALDGVLDMKVTVDRVEESAAEGQGWPDIPGYEIVRLIDVGGMGKIYKARHKILGMARAVKVMRSSQVSADALERFRREMTVGARFEHESIVPVYEAGLLADGNPYFVMPLVRGGSLKDHLPRYRADPAPAVLLMAEVCRAVGYAHERGIVHRDLKPGNILLTEEGKPLVADFGIAKLLSRQPEAVTDTGASASADDDTPVDPAAGTRITQTGMIIGTWAYLSPEAVRGRTSSVDGRSDIWALGVILYELLAGEVPFRAKDPVDVAAQITEAQLPAPKGDPTLTRVVMRCLRKDPGERYPTASALADDLEAWAAGGPPAGVVPTWGYWLRWQARRWWKVAAALALLLSLGLTLLAILHEGPSERERFLDAVGAKLERLRRGQKVTLIGRGVEPVSLLAFGNGRTRRPNEPGGAVVFASDGPARWELLPEVPTPNASYRVEVEIAHTAVYPGDNQCGGVALAGTDVWTAEGREHAFLLCGLAEKGSLVTKFGRRRGQPSGGAFLTSLLLGEDQRHPYHWHPGVPLNRWVGYIPLSGKNRPPPRGMAVDFRPDGLSAGLSDRQRPFVTLGRAELGSAREASQATFRRHIPDIPIEAARFPAEGTLGILTRDSEVVVTRLEVIPTGR